MMFRATNGGVWRTARGAAETYSDEQRLSLAEIINATRSPQEEKESEAPAPVHPAILDEARWFQSLTENILDTVVVLDATGHFLFASHSVKELLGYGVEELAGWNAFALIHPEDLEIASQAFQTGVGDPATSQSARIRLRRRDGTWRIVEAVGQSRLKDPDFQGVVVTCRDVTERMKMETELRQSHEQFQQMFRASPVPVTVVTLAEGQFRDVNEAFLRVTGFVRAEVIGRTAIDLGIWAHPEERSRLMAELAREGKVRNFETLFRTKLGEPWHCLVSIERTELGGEDCLLFISNDITERKRAEEHIREQAALLDRAHDAICVTDLDQRILYWNSSAERLYGWPAGEAIGRNASDLLFQRGGISPPMESFKHLIRHGQWQGEVAQQDRQGRCIVVDSRWTLMRDAQQQPRSILVINSDITEKKRLEEHNLRTQRMENIGALAGGIAHDLNNILTPMLTAAEYFQTRMQDPESRKLLDILNASARRGSDLVRQILTFARGQETEFHPLQIRHVIREVASLLTETFPPTIRIQTHVEPDLPLVVGNATQLHQVLLNLCVNARDAMQEGGLLTLSAVVAELDGGGSAPGDRGSGRHVRVTVKDTGDGILPEDQARVFEPFFTTKPSGQGTGLGLSTVAELVRRHGGWVEMKSEVGQGTAFEVLLPARAIGAGELAGPDSGEPLQGCGEQILVVDDEVGVLELVRAQLETLGYRVLTASEGMEALRLFRRNRGEVQVVITDVLMPGLDGPSLCRALRATDSSVRIVCISGTSAPDEDERGPLDADVFLGKPFTSMALSRVLRQLLDAE